MSFANEPSSTVAPSAALGKRFEWARLQAGRSVEEVAAFSGVTVSCIHGLEAGVWTPADRPLWRICRTLKMDFPGQLGSLAGQKSRSHGGWT